MDKPRPIVAYLIQTEEEGCRRSQEYAGAGEIWERHAALVPICDHGYWAIGRGPATRTDSWFQNRIGAHYGSDNRDKSRVPGEWTHQMDWFSLARAVFHGRAILADPERYPLVWSGALYDGPTIYPKGGKHYSIKGWGDPLMRVAKPAFGSTGYRYYGKHPDGKRRTSWGPVTREGVRPDERIISPEELAEWRAFDNEESN